MSRVAVSRVEPARLHGFRPGELVIKDLDPGLNVFYAPNATGKSTLARAIGLLFNPASCDADANVAGEICGPSGVETFVVRRNDPLYPGFPGRPESYLLDLVRLLEGFRDRDDQSVLRRLVANNLTLAPSRVSFRRPAGVRQAADALDELRRIRQKDEVAKLEDRLEGLRRQAAEAHAARRAVEALDALARRRDLESGLSSVRERLIALDAAHPGLERQSEGDDGIARLLSKELAAVEGAVADARAALAEVCARPPSRPLAAADREALERAGRDVAAAAGFVRSQASARDAAKARAVMQAEALLNLLPGEDPEGLPMPTQDDMAVLRAAAAQHDAYRAAALRLEAFRDAHLAWKERHPDDDSELEPTIEAAKAWLSETSVASRDHRPALLFVVLATVAVLAAFLDAPARYAVVAAGVATAAGIAFGMRPPAAGDRREEIAARFPSFFAGADAFGVAESLRGLLLRAARREVRGDLASRAQGAPPTEGWADVATTLRLRVVDPCLLAPVGTSIQTYLQAVADHRAAEVAHNEAERELRAARAVVRTALGAYGFPAVDDVPEASVGDFLRWFDLAQALDTKLAAEDMAKNALAEAVEESGAPNLETLTTRAPLVRARKALLDEVAQAERDISALATPAAAHASLSDEEAATLRAEKAALAEEASTLDQAVGGAVNEIQAAESSTRLQAAEDGFAKAYAALEAKWMETARGAVRSRLHAALADRLRREDLPPIVQAANVHLARFTSGRYRLELGASEDGCLGSLVVRDRDRTREQRFAELSAGTKVHAMVALRIGLIEEHERQANGGTLRFPLVVDEAMAMSDPDASAAIAEALVAVAQDRQVIVFTNQPDDLAHLGVAARTLGSEPPAQHPAAELPRYRPPHGPATFDPTLPIGIHTVSAVLPFTSEAPTVNEWLLDGGAGMADYVRALDRMRNELAQDFPRLDWAAIQGEAWTNNAFRARAWEIADGCGGCARTFIEAFESIPRIRTETVRQARAWLDANDYLKDPPTTDELRALVSRILGPDGDPFHIDHAVRLFRTAFG